MSYLKAVIFDFEDVLFETERLGHRIAYNRAFSDARLDWHWDDTLYAELLMIPEGRARIQYYLENFHLHCGTQQDLSEWVTQLYQAKQQHYANLIQRGEMPCRDGIEALFTMLADQQIKRAYLASGTQQICDHLLQTLAIPAAFDGQCVEADKADVYCYQHCLQQLDIDVASCVLLTDNASSLQAARQLDLSTVVLTHAYNQTQDFTGAQGLTDSLSILNMQTLQAFNDR